MKRKEEVLDSMETFSNIDNPSLFFSGKSEQRFIPDTGKLRQMKFFYGIDQENDNPFAVDNEYNDKLSKALLGISAENLNRGLYMCKAPVQSQAVYKKQQPARLALTIKKTMTAQRLINDYYLNLLDWSTNGQIYLGVCNSLYAYNPSDSTIHNLINSNRIITAVCARPDKVLHSTHGNPFTKVVFSFIDTQTGDNQRTFESEYSSYNVIRSKEPEIFYAGNTMGDIARVDFRQPTALEKLEQKKYQTKILALSIKGQLLATGDNSNKVCLWDIKKYDKPFFTYTEHTAAVKALEFSPWYEGIIASGGGTGDHSLRVWNYNTGKDICIEKTENQICNLHWINKNTVFTTHGGWEVTPKVKLWSIGRNSLKLLDSGKQEQKRELFSTQNPKNPYMFFTGTAEKGVTLWNTRPEEPRKVLQEKPGFLNYPSIR